MATATVEDVEDVTQIHATASLTTNLIADRSQNHAIFVVLKDLQDHRGLVDHQDVKELKVVVVHKENQDAEDKRDHVASKENQD